MSREPLSSRRRALKCLAYGGAGTLFTLAGGVLTPVDLLAASTQPVPLARLGRPLFVQISDMHIGFNKDANPDVAATLRQSIALVNALPQPPALILHTGDITHTSAAAEFDLAQQLLAGFRTTELHTVPGEHDVSDASVREYFNRFGAPSAARGYYSFDHAGVHFIAPINALNFRPGTPGQLGEEQIGWLRADLRARSASTPIVVFAHMPLWSIYEPWGWGTSDAEQLLQPLRRFGILNGHIHQIVQNLEGNMLFHTARSTAYPQPAAGAASGPGPMQVPAERLSQMLGVTAVAASAHARRLSLSDATLDDSAAGSA